MSQVSDLEAHAKPCQVIISSEVLAVTEDICLTTQLSSTSYRLDELQDVPQVSLTLLSLVLSHIMFWVRLGRSELGCTLQMSTRMHLY